MSLDGWHLIMEFAGMVLGDVSVKANFTLMGKKEEEAQISVIIVMIVIFLCNLNALSATCAASPGLKYCSGRKFTTEANDAKLQNDKAPHKNTLPSFLFRLKK